MKGKIRVLIADDEALGRKEMRRLLKKHVEVEIVAEACDGDEAVALIEKHTPDLVFLDIRMPGRDGFEVLDALEPPLPEIIFSTAYDQFAVNAIRRGALDYLLKPVAPEDLERAIEMARNRIDRSGKIRKGEVKLRSVDKIFVQEGKTALFLEIGSICALKSEGNYTKICSLHGHGLVRRSIKYFENRLDPQEFFRANRSQVINLKFVKDCKPCSGHRLLVSLEHGDPIVLSRRQAQAFRQRLQV